MSSHTHEAQSTSIWIHVFAAVHIRQWYAMTTQFNVGVCVCVWCEGQSTGFPHDWLYSLFNMFANANPSPSGISIHKRQKQMVKRQYGPGTRASDSLVHHILSSGMDKRWAFPNCPLIWCGTNMCAALELDWCWTAARAFMSITAYLKHSKAYEASTAQQYKTDGKTGGRTA